MSEQTRMIERKQDSKHTTIAIQKNTKKKLDDNRAPGQCYDGFINELVGYWERYRIGSSLCGPGKPIYQEKCESI
jgi:hypothetical protein